MTFKEYISTRQARDNPQGDFINDAQQASEMPDVQSWAELKSYLKRQGGDDDAIYAGRLVWSAYQQKIRRAKRSNRI